MSSLLWKIFGRSVIVIEVAGLAGAYWVWNELKTNPEAREKMNARAPFVMEAFNKVRACVRPNMVYPVGTDVESFPFHCRFMATPTILPQATMQRAKAHRAIELAKPNSGAHSPKPNVKDDVSPITNLSII